jgi:hypothetical protein
MGAIATIPTERGRSGALHRHPSGKFPPISAIRE